MIWLILRQNDSFLLGRKKLLASPILKFKRTKIVVQEPTVRAKIAGSCPNLPTSGDPNTPSEVHMGPKHDDLR